MATVGGIKVSATGASRLHRNVWRSGALGAFGGDGAEFFDGEEVFFAADSLLGCYEIFEGDERADAAEECDVDRVLTEAIEIADAFDGGEYVEDAAVGFQVEICHARAPRRVVHEGEFFMRDAMDRVKIGERGAELVDGFGRENGTNIEVVSNERRAVEHTRKAADDHELYFGVSQSLQKSVQTFHGRCLLLSVRGRVRELIRGEGRVVRA